MKKIIIILLGVIVYCACQDDDKHSWVQPEISFSYFQDQEVKVYVTFS